MSKTATEHPILFNAEMVRAVLDGRKTQTRRVVNFDRLRVIPRRTITSDIPFGIGKEYGACVEGVKTKATMNHYGAVCGLSDTGEWLGLKPGEFDFVCPYADNAATYLCGSEWRLSVCDSRLWVRETFQLLIRDEFHDSAMNPQWNDVDYKTGRGYRVSYPATDGIVEFFNCDNELSDACKPSIFMPRWASRINLEVVSVRVERVQDISEEDAAAEGVDANAYLCSRNDEAAEHAHRDAFADLWDSINGKPREDGTDISWAANPWVFRIEFARLTP